MVSGPTFDLERTAMTKGAVRIAGVDEVGRGPLAGPVTVAAVILDPTRLPQGLNDSKKLTAKRREVLAKQIHATAEVVIVHATVQQIDQLNILGATLWAMSEALRQIQPDHALIDGTQLPKDLPCSAEAVKGGDGKSLSISAASIVAKVMRDSIMVDLAQQHPGYGWETNAGYGTTVHFRALSEKGITPHHRRSFAPIRNML